MPSNIDGIFTLSEIIRLDLEFYKADTSKVQVYTEDVRKIVDAIHSSTGSIRTILSYEIFTWTDLDDLHYYMNTFMFRPQSFSDEDMIMAFATKKVRSDMFEIESFPLPFLDLNIPHNDLPHLFDDDDGDFTGEDTDLFSSWLNTNLEHSYYIFPEANRTMEPIINIFNY